MAAALFKAETFAKPPSVVHFCVAALLARLPNFMLCLRSLRYCALNCIRI